MATDSDLLIATHEPDCCTTYFYQSQPCRLRLDRQTCRSWATSQGTIAYAVQRLEEYRNDLENRVVRRFDAATAAGDLEAMAECSRIMTEFPRGEDIVTQVHTVVVCSICVRLVCCLYMMR